ncbi:MAG TPA: EAL domain-containing protein [Rhizomicrobium sp.]|nr:EAL domain-containing protein [Rhizomicrobium sp.]
MLASLLFAVAASAAPLTVPKEARSHASLDFARRDAMLDLKDALSPYHAPAGAERDGSLWFMMTAVNQSVRPVTRILVAGEPSDGALHFFPLRGRPVIRQIASSDSDVGVESARAYGRHAWRVTIPPATSVALAVRMEHAGAAPSVLAWTEPAIISHIRQFAVFMAAVEGLIAAAVLVTAGLALMTGHLAPRWAALTLIAIFFSRLASTGAFDAGWTTSVGGPYGLSAMIAGFALAAGIKLADTVAPFGEFFTGAKRWVRWIESGVVILSLLAFAGLPGATVLVEIAVLAGTGAITAYFVHRGMAGVQAARVAAPSAAVFSLVATAAAVAALGGFQDNPAAPAMIGGFLSAGAVLMALAIAAGEGIAILPATRATAVAAAAPLAPVAVVAPIQAPREEPVSTALEAIGASCQGVFDLDFRGDTVTLSRDGALLIGMQGGGEMTMPHISWLARVHPDDREVYKQAIADYRGHAGQAFRVELRARSESGRYPWFELRATMLGEGARATRCLGLIADVTTRKEAEAAASDHGQRDALTGLGNRVALMEELDRRGLSTILFALLDIDRFKSIHASLGDAGADAVLVAIAQRLVKRFKGRAETFRAGGDAFAFVFAEGEAAEIGAELVEACKAPISLGGRNVFAPVSVGVALGGEARDPLDLLKNAELALIEAKRQGGGCARLHSADFTAPEDAVALEAELRRALDEKQMDVFYQPIVRLTDATVAGFEALLRWHHPTRGLVVPGAFITHSEATGLIVALGRFALERAAQDLAQWQRFFPLEPALFVSVNLSRRQLNDGALGGDLSRVLSESAIRPGSLKLEVTESAVAARDDTKAVLLRLRELGASLVIDDFGTGLSTLSQLRDVPFDTIKIDKSFLARHASDPDNADGAVVLGSIVKMAQELGRSVVVEGVEGEADANWLADLGCEFAQGFFFSAPLPAADALAFIARHYRTDAPHGDTAVTDLGAAGVDGQA